MSTVRTRFAPSPTGYMHVGNLRTALYTYLQARHNGGTFILRIEDTDQGRLVEGATDIIYGTLKATGLTWDEGPDVGGPVGPYVQSQRMGMFKQYAEQLVKAGKAYYCFCTEERLNEMHEAQRAAGEMTHYDGHCRHLSAEEVAAKLAAGEPYVIRQKIPESGVAGFDDVVYGHIEVDVRELDDQILIKTDGMPTYNFANVVDDHLMGITHVIRGSEYLSSTPKYNLLYDAFGWEKPVYIHCPPVMKDAQNKLSKRNGDASYQDLVAKGYLPAAVLNYLLLLGWAPEGEQEIFSLDEMIKIWDPARISKSPAIFDPLKLRAINAAYIRALPAEEFRRLADPFIDSAVHCSIDRDLLCANLQPRCEVLEDIPPQLDFFDAVLPIDAEMYRNKKQKTTPESAKEALTALLPVLEAQTDWTRDAIFEACKTLAESMEKKNGWLLFPLGIALSGKSRTPGGGTDLAAMMGKEETVKRVKAALEKLGRGREPCRGPKLRIKASSLPPPPAGGLLRSRAPLSLRDISPRSGESPSQRGPRSLFAIYKNGAATYNVAAPYFCFRPAGRKLHHIYYLLFLIYFYSIVPPPTTTSPSYSTTAWPRVMARWGSSKTTFTRPFSSG